MALRLSTGEEDVQSYAILHEDYMAVDSDVFNRFLRSLRGLIRLVVERDTSFVWTHYHNVGLVLEIGPVISEYIHLRRPLILHKN